MKKFRKTKKSLYVLVALILVASMFLLVACNGPVDKYYKKWQKTEVKSATDVIEISGLSVKAGTLLLWSPTTITITLNRSYNGEVMTFDMAMAYRGFSGIIPKVIQDQTGLGSTNSKVLTLAGTYNRATDQAEVEAHFYANANSDSNPENLKQQGTLSSVVAASGIRGLGLTNFVEYVKDNFDMMSAFKMSNKIKEKSGEISGTISSPLKDEKIVELMDILKNVINDVMSSDSISADIKSIITSITGSDIMGFFLGIAEFSGAKVSGTVKDKKLSTLNTTMDINGSMSAQTLKTAIDSLPDSIDLTAYESLISNVTANGATVALKVSTKSTFTY